MKKSGKTEPSDTWAQVEQLHRSPWMVALVTAGAGSEAIEQLLNHPGASNTVLDVQVPYSLAALRRYAPGVIGAVSADTALGLADRARTLGMALAPPDRPVAGVSCTAALATTRVRRGAEEGFIAVSAPNRREIVHVHFRKGKQDRGHEERWISHALLNAIAGVASVPECRLTAKPIPEIQRIAVPGLRPLDAFWRGEVDEVVVERDGRVVPAPARLDVLLPGSFNPLHRGHDRLLQIATTILEKPVTLELSVHNVDKSELTAQELARRLRHTDRKHCVAVTRAPLFINKARRFPGCWFVLGHDTAVRLIDESYYGGADGLNAMLVEMEQLRCRFLVAGREAEGRFLQWEDERVPGRFGDLFVPIPKNAFREDVRAEDIRAARRDYGVPR